MSSKARQAVRNGRRRKRHGSKAWMADRPVMKTGNGGTDHSGRWSKNYRSQASAEIFRGTPHHWPGLEFRPK